MKKKVYYLSTCTTCQRIMKELDLTGFEQKDIKDNPINESELEELYAHTKSYEALFNKRAMKYRSMGLNEKSLSEDDFKKYLLEEYTFLKRPVFVVGDDVFVGNAKKTVQSLHYKLQ